MSDAILIVEDEPDIVELVQYNLEKAGFTVLAAVDGAEGVRRTREKLPALVILDLMLPGLDGMEVCRLLKQDERTRAIPIIMLTARGEEMDRVVGLELGADDYVVKPFSPRELVLRVKAVLRRTRADAEPSQVVQAGSLTIDLDGHHVAVAGRPVTLTATEFKLLVTLFQRRGRVQTRDELLNSVWGYDYFGYGRTVDAHIKRLREKLGAAGGMIETVRGVGYRFVK